MPNQVSEGLRRPPVKPSTMQMKNYLSGPRAFDFALREIALKDLKHGIALGCVRKYISMLNGSDQNPIARLAYFKNAISAA